MAVGGLVFLPQAPGTRWSFSVRAHGGGGGFALSVHPAVAARSRGGETEKPKEPSGAENALEANFAPVSGRPSAMLGCSEGDPGFAARGCFPGGGDDMLMQEQLW